VLLARRLVAEALGSAFLLAAIVGTGITSEHLANGDLALELLAVSFATGATLFALILILGPISGAHFNPAVTLCDALRSGTGWAYVGPYVAAQTAGAYAGAATANAMFGLPVIAFSQHVRSGSGQLLGEFVATFGLLAIIWGCSRLRSPSTPLAIGAYIAAAIWFTSSTAFANPAVTLARTITDTFTGIRPGDAPAYIAMQLLGALAATALFAWLAPAEHVRET
jgi:glycerol uptake facilitator-like aquaporin